MILKYVLNLPNDEYKDSEKDYSLIDRTRKYPLCKYILGVLTHTTAWDRHWGGDITLE